jgi:hypothetical protein
MPNPFSPVLRPLGLDPSQGYDTAAAGAKQAQQQLNSLSDLQWQRQMGGLQQATGYVDQLQALYNSLYGPGGGHAAAGGRGPQANVQPVGAGLTLSSLNMPGTDGARQTAMSQLPPGVDPNTGVAKWRAGLT